MEVNQIIGENVKRLRTERNLSLGKLADACGVSKVMISQIEKGGANPTINTLWKIAGGLGVTYSALLEEKEPETQVVRYSEAAMQADEDGGYRLLCYFPSTPSRDFELFQCELDAGCTHVTDGHPSHSREFVLVTRGTLDIAIGQERYSLQAGDCAGFDATQRHEYANTTGETTVFTCINHYPA
ncbi:MAG: helix-turn-helix domain-containing protein [Eggerthellaceae bacterium]|jgi:transcriptional regulator with XRE-family HTH domain